MQYKFLVVNKSVHGQCGWSPPDTSAGGGSTVSSCGCCPAVAQEQWRSVFQGLTSFSECFKCWLCVLGSLKKFLFPSCCSEQFCSCLLRKSPALASDQQWVGDVISNVQPQSQTHPPSCTTKEQTLWNCILISGNSAPFSNPWLLYKIQRICKEPPQKKPEHFVVLLWLWLYV